MEEAKKLIEELERLVEKNENSTRIDEIARWFRANHSEENVVMLQKFLDDGLHRIDERAATLIQELRKR